jgi:hypothetical protein
MPKFYVQSGTAIRRMVSCSNAVIAAKLALREWLKRGDSRLDLGEGIIVCEKGFFKDLTSKKFAGIMKLGEIKKRKRKISIVRDIDENYEGRPEETVIFLVEEIERLLR